MIKSNQEKKEEILKRFEDLNKKGVKLTKKNLDDVDPDLYENAKDLFNGSWMQAKNAYYNYIEQTKNPERNLQRLIIQKVEQFQEEYNIPIIKNNKLNKLFVNSVEKNDVFLKNVILNSFTNWDTFFVEYIKNYESEEPEFSEEELSKGIALAVETDDIIKENLFAEKYGEIHKAILKEYGSLKKALIHFLRDINHNI